MVTAGGHKHGIGNRVLRGHKQGLLVPREPRALANCVQENALVLANYPAIDRYDWAGLRRNVCGRPGIEKKRGGGEVSWR
jgi:hypothetical protein